MGLKTFHGGVHPPDNKSYSKSSKIIKAKLPKKVVIHLNQHIGAPAKATVKLKDEVKTGQIIAKTGGFVSIPMHSSITGTVTKIAEFPHPTGSLQMGIEITGDGEKDEWIDLIDDENYMDLSIAEMKKRISDAGICGMGGAGFPTHVKLSPPKDKPIDTVILNGVECEPFLTADYRLMLEQTEEIVKGLKILMKIVDAKKGIIGIEANKPDAIKLMKNFVKSDSNLSVVGLKLKYPQGAEKQLIYACTKRKVPNKGGLPMDVNVVVQNVGTAVAVYEAVKHKKPLIERVITVTGKIVKKPANYLARIGTYYRELLDESEGVNENIGKVISGGPMMGFAIPTLDTPMTKGSSGLVIFDEEEAKSDEEQTCIRCASCVDICPMNLLPTEIVTGAKNQDWEKANSAGVMDCIKCGSCAFVCPSNIKFIQWIDIGKMEVAKILNAK
ncbi:MAG: electron transport complex subunit RsxC [Candidatus Cloacimonadota bacterium]|nr:electron transport complex subunit RsxC [Candidatus Cloacimonadota bacterium]